MALNGNFYNLGIEGENELSFQPLSKIDNEQEKTWASEWLLNYLRLENYTVTPREKELVWDAINSLVDMPTGQRTMTVFNGLVQDESLRQAFSPLSHGGSYGKAFAGRRRTAFGFTFSTSSAIRPTCILSSPL